MSIQPSSCSHATRAVPCPRENSDLPSEESLPTAVEKIKTAIIADTLHFETLSFYEPDASLISLDNIIKGLGDTSQGVSYHLWAAVRQTIDERHDRRILPDFLTRASLERFLVEVGCAVQGRVHGPQFVVIDPRRCSDAASITRSARRLMELYAEKKVGKDHVVISIPATDEGLMASKELQTSQAVHTNVYGVCTLSHAAACAEACASVVTIPVGKLLLAYERIRKTSYEDLRNHPGVELILSILAYFKLRKPSTIVMGSDFRELSELKAFFSLFDVVCLTRAQTKHIQWLRVKVSSLLAPTTPALLRARQAQFPSSFLSGPLPGVTRLVSPFSKSILEEVLYVTLQRWQVKMDALDSIMNAEVQRQFDLQIFDLPTLYKRARQQECEAVTWRCL